MLSVAIPSTWALAFFSFFSRCSKQPDCGAYVLLLPTWTEQYRIDYSPIIRSTDTPRTLTSTGSLVNDDDESCRCTPPRFQVHKLSSIEQKLPRLSASSATSVGRSALSGMSVVLKAPADRLRARLGFRRFARLAEFRSYHLAGRTERRRCAPISGCGRARRRTASALRRLPIDEDRQLADAATEAGSRSICSRCLLLCR